MSIQPCRSALRSPLARAAVVLLALAPAAGASLPQRAGTPPREATPGEPAAARVRELPVLDAAGAVVATRAAGPDARSLRLRTADGARFVAPAYQRWLGSADGRTLLGVGDPDAPEHPFELRFTVYRDGAAVARASETLDPESRFAVSPDGRVLVAGHAVGERQRWWVRALGVDGRESYRAELPRGLQVASVALLGDHALVLSHEPFTSRTSGAVRAGRLLRVDAAGVGELGTFDGAQEVVAFPALGGALLRTSAELAWLDEASGAVRWRRAIRVRPAGPHAWTSWRTPVGDVLAVLASDVRRRGEPAPPVRLVLVRAADGALLGERAVERHGPLALARLRSEGERLVLDWMGREEVFPWQR